MAGRAIANCFPLMPHVNRPIPPSTNGTRRREIPPATIHAASSLGGGNTHEPEERIRPTGGPRRNGHGARGWRGEPVEGSSQKVDAARTAQGARRRRRVTPGPTAPPARLEDAEPSSASAWRRSGTLRRPKGHRAAVEGLGRQTVRASAGATERWIRSARCAPATVPAAQTNHRGAEIHPGDRGGRTLAPRLQRHVRRSRADVQEPTAGGQPGRLDRFAPPDAVPPCAPVRGSRNHTARAMAGEHALHRRPLLCHAIALLVRHGDVYR